MNTFSKKLVSTALMATTIVWASGALLLFPVANAQTTASLQTQIAALLAQIQQLQTQLGAPQGPSMASFNFTRSLTVGSTGNDVKALQQFLNSNGAQVAATGAGSPGNESTYFGPKTRAALAVYQASVGISPAIGFFGSITRGRVNALAVAPPGMPPAIPGQPPVVAPASGLWVGLAPGMEGLSAVAGAGQLEVGKFKLTAGTGAGVTVTGITFNKVGVVSDTHVNNLYLADETGAVIAQYSSLNQRVAIFSGMNIQVNAGQTKTLTLRMDLSSGASAGNTIAWTVDTVTADTATVSGLPVNLPTVNVTKVSSPDLAKVTWNFNDVSSAIDAGTNGVLIGTASVEVSNSAVWMKNVKYTLIGSANMGDIRNLKLMVNGMQVGNTIAQAPANGVVVFNLSANPARVSTGNVVVDLYADIAGSPNREVTVRILRPYDLLFTDSQYNTGISPTVTDDSNKITINKGQITLTLASDTPTGNIPKGASNVTLAKFTIYAAGENVKVKFLNLTITQGSAGDAWTTIANVTEDIQNISIVDDAGNQVGSTISTIVGGTDTGQCTLTSATVITCHFGTSSSNINYIVPANTTRVLSAKVDILSTNDAPSLRAGLAAMTNNLEGQVSFQQASTGAANGATLTVTSNPLTLNLNGAFAAPTYVAGANNVKIASFVIAASSAEGARITSLTFDKDSNANFDIQNLKVMVGTTQFGTTRPIIGDAETSLTFSGVAPIIVNSGGSVTVDVYADILTGTTAATHTAPIDYVSFTAIGLVSNSSITAAGAVSGQNVIISSGPTVTVAIDSNTPSAAQVVMGGSDLTVFSARFTNDNVEDVRITDVVFLDTITGTTSTLTSFKDMKWYDGVTLLGGAQTPTIAGNSTSTMTFSFGSTPVILLKNSSKILTLKGNLASFTDGGVSNSIHTWSINATSSVTAFGKDSASSVTISGTASGSAQTVYRSKLTFTSSLIAGASARPRVAVDDLVTVNWTADSAYQLTLGTVAIKFSGQAVSAGSTAFTVDFLKSDNTAFGSATVQTCTPGAGNSCSVTFSPQFIVSAGGTQAAKIRINSGSFFNGANTGDSLSAVIIAAGDVLWNDGTTAGITLEASKANTTLVNVSYE